MQKCGRSVGARLFSWSVAELEAETKGDAEVRGPVRKDGLGGF